MSSYVLRTRPDGSIGWTGPIRTPDRAEREAQAWRDAGYGAIVFASSPEVRRQVRDWERARCRA